MTHKQNLICRAGCNVSLAHASTTDGLKKKKKSWESMRRYPVIK